MLALIPRIIITPGEPAGIGPDIVLQIATMDFDAELIVMADPHLLAERAKMLGLTIEFREANLTKRPLPHEPGTLSIIPLSLKTPCEPGKLNPDNAAYVIESLALATDYCLSSKASALVTGPVQKSIINEAGIPFTGHTEFLANRCSVTDVLMLFVVNQLKVALVTTHIPLKDVPITITKDRIIRAAKRLHSDLQTRFGIKHPKIFVAGLNPHAGENGHLGHEERDVIQPAIAALQADALDILGPFPADTLFTDTSLAGADAILAMYHDQALPVVKHLGFYDAVNVTLGLPIIRTSVDHGTALDLAGTGKANPGSLTAAIRLAIQLSKVTE